MKKISKEELETIKSFIADFNKMKTRLGDLLIAQNDTMKGIDELKRSHSAYEDKLVKKYGKDSVIDISTGEVKKQEKNG